MHLNVGKPKELDHLDLYVTNDCGNTVDETHIETA